MRNRNIWIWIWDLPFVVLLSPCAVFLGMTAAVFFICLALVVWTFQVNFVWGLLALIAFPILFRLLMIPFAILLALLQAFLKED